MSIHLSENTRVDRFNLILKLAKRGHALQSGIAEASLPLTHPDEKVTLTAIREFEANLTSQRLSKA